MFKYKTQEELQKMSAEELEKYHGEMKAHEADVRKKEIEAATKEVEQNAKKAAEEAAKEAVEKLNRERAEGVTKEDFQKFQTQTNEQLNNIGKAAGSKEEAVSAVAKEFDSQYKAKMEGATDQKGLMEGKVTIKAWDSADTMTVTDVPSSTYPTNGTTGIVGGVVGFFGRLIPTFFRKPRPYSKILNYVTVEPTEDETQATVISEDYVGEAAITKECALKPIVKVTFEPKTVQYDFVAVFWKTSRLLLRLFKKMGYNMQKRFNELLMEALPNAVLAATRAGGVAFTPDPSFKVSTPNNFDAIVAMISGLVNRGFVPNAVLVSPIAYGLMLTSKGSDGHYNLSNGGSIQIVGSTLKYGEFDIEIVQDPKLAAGEVIVGDLTLVHVFVDNKVEYHQGYNDNDDMRRNIVSNVLENLVAIVIPNGAQTGIIKDTFANVKTLITATP